MLRQLKAGFVQALNHQGFRRYFSNTSWMFAEQILRLLAGLFVGIWVARYLGPEQYGLFSYSLAFVALFASVAKLGLDSFVVRALVQEPDKREVYLGTVFWLKLAGALLALMLIAIALVFVAVEGYLQVYIFIIASGLVFQAFEVIDFYFQSQVKSRFVAYGKLVQLLCTSLLKIYLVVTGAELIYFVMISLIDQIILALALLGTYRMRINRNFLRQFDMRIAKDLLHQSWPVILSGMVLMIQARIDQIMLRELLGNAALGQYSAALRLIEACSFIPVVLVSSLFPAIVNAKSRSHAQYQHRLYNLYRLMMALFVLIALPLALFGNKLVLMLYGDSYAPAGQLLALMSIRLLFTNFGVVRGAYLTNENRMSYALLTMTIGTLVNIGLNLWWIPQYQAEGAVWATIISFFVTTFFIDVIHPAARSNCALMFKGMLIFGRRG